MSEATFSKRLRDEMAAYNIRTYRIESPTSPGLPDMHFISDNRELTCGWIETKNEAFPPNKVAYRPGQALWLLSYADFGGISMTLIYVSSVRQVIMIPGKFSNRAEKSLRESCGQLTFDVSKKEGWAVLCKAISEAR